MPKADMIHVVKKCEAFGNPNVLLTERGTIESFTGKRADLVALMGNKGTQVEKFIKSNKLDLDDKYEFSQIVAYFNSL